MDTIQQSFLKIPTFVSPEERVFPSPGALKRDGPLALFINLVWLTLCLHWFTTNYCKTSIRTLTPPKCFNKVSLTLLHYVAGSKQNVKPRLLSGALSKPSPILTTNQQTHSCTLLHEAIRLTGIHAWYITHHAWRSFFERGTVGLFHCAGMRPSSNSYEFSFQLHVNTLATYRRCFMCSGHGAIKSWWMIRAPQSRR